MSPQKGANFRKKRFKVHSETFSALIVYLAPVSDLHNYDQYNIVLYLRKKSVISDTVSPCTGEISRQCLSVYTWVCTILEILLYPVHYDLTVQTVCLLKLFETFFGKKNFISLLHFPASS